MTLERNMKSYSKYIDHSPLKMDAKESEIIAYCKEAVEYSFHSIVVFPHFIELAKKTVVGTDVKVVTVAGFPFGNELIEIKAKQAEEYLELGTDEIDMVMNVSAFKSGKIDYVKRDIDNVLRKVKKRHGLLKVIIEVELLSKKEIIEACNIVADVGADYVKTSTGLLKTSKPIEVETVKLMYDTISSKGVKVKASGSIHTPEKFLTMIDVGASRIGTSRGIDIITGIRGTKKETNIS